MKKFFLFFLLFLIPMNIKAAKINNAEIVSETEKKMGDIVEVDFNIKFSDLEKGYDKTYGIWVIGFKINYDEDVLKPISVFSEHFMSDIYIDSETKEYYVMSEVIENSSSDLNCAEGLLYCGDYSLTIKFFIDKTEKESTSIEMSNIEVGFLDIVDENKTYTFDDLIEINSSITKNKTINIKQSNGKIETPKESITITQSNKENIVTNIPEIKKEEYKKSSNSLLKSMQIENYALDFDKNIKEYTLTVDSSVNKLNVSVEPEDSKATYKIIGAEDLKANNYEISIEVTAEDNSKNIYKIKVEQKEINEIEEEINIKETKQNKINKNIFIYLSITLSIITIIAIILLIINKKRNKYIDKYLDNL